MAQDTDAYVRSFGVRRSAWGALSAEQRFGTFLPIYTGNGYVSLCPELNIASQGDTIEVARQNLQEVLDLFIETVSPAEIQSRFQNVGVKVTSWEACESCVRQVR